MRLVPHVRHGKGRLAGKNAVAMSGYELQADFHPTDTEGDGPTSRISEKEVPSAVCRKEVRFH